MFSILKLLAAKNIKSNHTTPPMQLNDILKLMILVIKMIFFCIFNQVNLAEGRFLNRTGSEIGHWE